MRRREFLIGSAAALSSACISSCNQRPRLNVYNWSDYIAPNTVANFEREFKVRVHYGTYESNQEMLAQVMSGNSGWDVVFPSEDFIGPMRELGLLAGIDRHALPNLGALAPDFQQPPWDPSLSASVPYMHGVTGILYQKSLNAEPRNWSDLWSAKLRGHLTMLDDEPEVLGACLLKLGFPLNSGDTAQLASAQREAIAQKQLLRAYLNAEVRDQAIAGDVLAAQAWAVTASQAINGASDKLAFALPREGFPRYADNMAILRESRRPELAHQWINYLLRPEVAASIVVSTRTATANGAASYLLPEEIRNDSVLFPAPEVLVKGQWFETPSAASQKLRDRLWTEIKSS